MKLKRRILNISLAVLLLLTCIAALAGMIQIEIESRQYHGAELVGFGGAIAAVLIICGILMISELSIYCNLRYFLLCQRKTTLQTVLNILFLIWPMGLVAFVRYGIEGTDLQGILYLSLWVLFLLLRTVNFAIQVSSAESAHAQ